MIFSTLNQINIFIIFLFFGFLIGFIFNIFSTLFLQKYQKNYQKNIFFCIFSAFFVLFFTFLKNIFNFGIFSPALLFGYGASFLYSIKLLKNLVVFLQNKWYTIFIKYILPKRKKNETKRRKS